MKTPVRTLLVASLAAVGSALRADAPLPRVWVDPDTGHRVEQLSTEPDTNSLYFTQYGYCAGGTKLIMLRHGAIDLATLSTGAVENVYQGSYYRVIQAGRKTGNIFLMKDGAVFCLDPATRQIRRLADIPDQGFIASINSDETLGLGVIGMRGVPTKENPDPRQMGDPPDDGPVSQYVPGQTEKGVDDFPQKMPGMIRRQAERRPMTLFVLNLATGERKDLYNSTDWLNHLQFSPTDPKQFSFCHEGPWWMIDRVWMMRTEGQFEPVLVHRRTMRAEIANHEYWSADGQWLWYDLQTPMNEDFWVAGYNVRTTERIWYHLTVDQWSIHYNRSPDGSLFCGDGGQPGHLGPQPKNSKYLFLFHPTLLPDPVPTPPQPDLIRVGTFRTERLVNLSQHDYSLEPNGNFSPDGKWVVFRSNMRGPILVYAVEVAKAAKAAQ